MNKLLVAVFDAESAVNDALRALRDAHAEGVVGLYAIAVVKRDATGALVVLQRHSDGSVDTTLATAIASFIRLLDRAPRTAYASTGALAAMVADLTSAGIDAEFLGEVETTLETGKTAVVAEIEETCSAAVDARLGTKAGAIFRRLRCEVIDELLAREVAILQRELEGLERARSEVDRHGTQRFQDEIESVQTKLRALQETARVALDQSGDEAKAKLGTLLAQLETAPDPRRVQIEKWRNEVREAYESRRSRLEIAREMAKQALGSTNLAPEATP